MSRQTGVELGHTLPVLPIDCWLQGELDLTQLRDRVVLLEFFQVNCPGCFLYALPKAIELHQQYAQQGLTIAAVATAFEDFEFNSLENLQHLLSDGSVVGETARVLGELGLLRAGKWPHRLPFAVAMDRLQVSDLPVSDVQINAFIAQQLPDIDQFAPDQQAQIRHNVRHYLNQRRFRPLTFELLNLQGTPSYLLLDKHGCLRSKRFGDYPELERDVMQLLAE